MCAIASVHYRAVAIRFGVVKLIVHAQERYTLGGPGGMLAAMRLLLRHFGANTMLLGSKMTEFHMNPILPITSYTTGGNFPIRFAYRPKATPFALVRTESCWKEDSRNSSVALFAAISQVSTWYLCASGHCVGVRRAMALIGNDIAGKPRVREKVVQLKPD